MTKRPNYRSRHAKTLAIRRFVLGFFFALSFVSFGFFEPWNWKNDPIAQWGEGVIVNYNQLKQKAGDEAHLNRVPWTNTYYPKRRGGFASRDIDIDESRWGRDSMNYEPYTEDELLGLTQSELRSLSAAEKLDIINGRARNPRSNSYYSYLEHVRKDIAPEVRDPNSQNAQYAGWCEPLALASIYHAEPDYTRYSVRVRSRSGRDSELTLPLTSSDIKAFIMMAYDEVLTNLDLSRTAPKDSVYKMLDRRCRPEGDPKYNEEHCRKMNAGAFHIILLNQLGIRKEGFVADLDSGGEVWNHPIEGYKILSEKKYEDENGRPLRSPGAAENSVREIEFQTKFYYIQTSYGLHTYAMGEDKIRDKYWYSRTMNYRIELDKDDNIVGGTWLGKKYIPDFFWTYPKIKKFEGDYSFLNDLLED